MFQPSKKTLLLFGAILALTGCSHSDQNKDATAPAHLVTAPTASAVSATPKPQTAAQRQLAQTTKAQLFVTAFGQGQLKLMQVKSGPGGLIAALVAPSGTKTLTPETPAAVLWILPGGDYALQGNLINRNGKNLTDDYLEKFGMAPVLIGEPASPPVAAAASAVSAGVAPVTSAHPAELRKQNSQKQPG